MKGISMMLYSTSQAQCIKKAGYDFIFRYYSVHTKYPEKLITVDEMKAIRAAGLKVAICYEYAGDHVGYFTQSTGERDGNFAYYFAQQMQQPPNSAIYFAVDYDATKKHVSGPIQDYFRAVLKAFNSSGDNQPIYRIGVYGSGDVCAWLRTHLSFIQYSWLAMSEGWRGRNTYDQWNVKQSKSTEDLCGFKRYRPRLDGDYEIVESQTDDFGQFTPTII